MEKVMEIMVKKPSPEELEKMGVFSWPIWEKEVSSFPWHYGEKETCYLLEGRVKVEPKGGSAVEFGKGDLVVFPAGMSCTWTIYEKVKKHYHFG